MNYNDDFAPEDYQFTADLLRQYAAEDSSLFQAVCSNNLNIILRALDDAAAKPVTCAQCGAHELIAEMLCLGCGHRQRLPRRVPA